MSHRKHKSQDIISVIISAYNSESTIEKTLISLESQDIDKSLYEVIIMDDGSTSHRMRDIIMDFQKHSTMQLHYFYQENQGVGRARNAGIAESVGKILAFTDADCICDPDWLSVIWRCLVTEKKKFIGGYTYSDDTVIFPWKMAPANQEGITANMAVDYTIIDGVVFDSGFTGMLGDDTDFVIRMGLSGSPLEYISEMRVLHPPNFLTLKKVIIRARGTHNLVGLYKKHGSKVLSSFSPVFRPIIFSRISPFAIITLILGLLLGGSFYYGGFSIFAAIIGFLIIFFHLYLYRFLVMYNPDGRPISFTERIKTFGFMLIIIPLFFYYRIVGMKKFRFFML